MSDHRAPLTVDQAAKLLDCAPDTVRDLARDGDLPGFKPGRDWIFPVGAFFARLDELAIEQAAQRRKPQPPSATLHALPAAAASSKQRRRPPALPGLPSSHGSA